MSKFKTELYVTGVVMTISWRDEDEHRQGKAFLRELAGAPATRTTTKWNEPDECYYLHEKDKFEALLDFRKALRKKRSSKK
ncbi:MAG: hypothetical protein ACOY4O_12175 [Pseudomonadota bacterium]